MPERVTELLHIPHCQSVRKAKAFAQSTTLPFFCIMKQTMQREENMNSQFKRNAVGFCLVHEHKASLKNTFQPKK